MLRTPLFRRGPDRLTLPPLGLYQAELSQLLTYQDLVLLPRLTLPLLATLLLAKLSKATTQDLALAPVVLIYKFSRLTVHGLNLAVNPLLMFGS